MALSLARMGSIPVSNEPHYNPFAEGEARRRAKQDAKKAELDLARATIENSRDALTQRELERTTKEGADARGIKRDFIINREGALDLPVGVRSPEFVNDQRPSNAPFGPMGAPVQRNPMETRAMIDLARINPDIAEQFRTGNTTERQGLEDRTRKIAGEDQKQIQEGADFGLKKQKYETDAQFEQRQQDEVERQNRAKNNIDWFIAKTGRQNADTAATIAKNKPVKATSDQNTYANYGRRLSQAEQDFRTLEASGFNRASLKAEAQSKMYEPLQPGQLKQQAQAERNFLNAVLRRESGAVISPTEFAEGSKQYFPRFGDSKENLEQKRRNRELVMQNFKNLSGPAWENAGGNVTGLNAEEEEEYRMLKEAAGL